MSFFSRVTKYAGGENRLTESFAALLELDSDLAWALARRWFGPQAPFPEVAAGHAQAFLAALDTRRCVSVRTQVRTRGGHYPDLELRFGESDLPSPDDLHVWVEIKHGIEPSELQLPNYVADMSAEHKTGAVVLLAPRTSLPFDERLVPPSVPQRSWETTGRQIIRTMPGVADVDPVRSWLSTEFGKYLREEGLMGPDAVRPEHLVTYAHHLEAEQALAILCEQAVHLVGEAGWPAQQEYRRRVGGHISYGYGYWASYPVSLIGLPEEPTEAATRWLDWNSRAEAAHPLAPSGRLIFTAGICAEQGQLVPRDDRDSVWQRRVQEGVETARGNYVRFTRFTDGGGYERLVRSAFPEEVLVGSTIEDQARHLGAWVVETFETLKTTFEGVPSGAHPG